MRKKNIYYTTFVIASLINGWVHAAPAAPDGGQVAREAEKRTDLAKPASAKSLTVNGQALAPVLANSDVKIPVQSVRVTGSTIFAASQLEELLSKLKGRDNSLQDLEEGAALITAYYRERGYLVATAYIPAQDITDGAVSIQVVEGVLASKKIENKSKLPDALVERYAGMVENGSVLQAQKVDRALLLLSDMAGVGGTRGVLQPGAGVGTTELVFEIEPGDTFASKVELDNYGSRYTGANRLEASIDVKSPLNMGDLLSARAMTSGPGMQFGRLAYEVPVGPSGLKLGGSHYRMQYKLGEEFANLGAHGTANNTGLFASYPFVRASLQNLYGVFTIERKDLQDQIDSVASKLEKQVNNITLAMAANNRDSIWNGGFSALEVALSRGELSMDAQTLAIDSAADSAKTNGTFFKLGYSLKREQTMNDYYSLLMSLSGQLADKNLNSSEKFSLGGVYGVRAYPQGEGAGDRGIMLNLEVRNYLSEKFQWSVFYDVGQVDINRNPFNAQSNTRTLAGLGLGASGRFDRLQYRAMLAWRTLGGDPVTDSNTSDPRLWMQLSLPL
jgi:hemolysin activation/secretion protein